MSGTDCLICQRIALARLGQNPYFVAELPTSIVVVGDHQFHRGYTLVLLKDHVKELHDLGSERACDHFAEVMRVGRAVVAAFRPTWTINYASYGNTAPHVHWHIFPRYAHDPDRTRNPWLHADDFGLHRIGVDEAGRLAAALRRNLER